MVKSVMSLTVAAILVMPSAGSAQPNYVPPAGYVPDEKTAIRIAKAVLGPVYGEARIEAQEPFAATLRDGVWTVEGQLPKGLVGGVALVEISKSDGRILRMIHGR